MRHTDSPFQQRQSDKQWLFPDPPLPPAHKDTVSQADIRHSGFLSSMSIPDGFPDIFSPKMVKHFDVTYICPFIDRKYPFILKDFFISSFRNKIPYSETFPLPDSSSSLPIPANSVLSISFIPIPPYSVNLCTRPTASILLKSCISVYLDRLNVRLIRSFTCKNLQ